MRALVLAGGSGTRLRPITHTSAKQLVPVANKPVLFYGLEAIADAGHHRGRDRRRRHRGRDRGGRRRRVARSGSRSPTSARRRRSGLAHAVLIARDFLGDDDFVMYLGDNFIVGGITDARRAVPRGPARPRRSCSPGSPTRAQFGVAELDDAGQVIGLEEKPAQPKSDLALVGVYLFTAAVHEAVRRAQALLARRAGDHRRHPVAHRPRHDGALHRRSPATGRTPGTSPTCWRSTGWCWRSVEPGCDGDGRRRHASSSAGSWSRRARR